MKNIIGIDIDNTISELHPTLEIISQKFNLDPISIDDVFSYDLCDSFGIKRELINPFWSEHELEIINKSVLSEARYNSILENFTDSKTEHYIITSRDEKYREQTERWLKLNAVKYDKLFMTSGKSKLKLIEELKLNYIVDDKPELFDEIENFKKNNKEGVIFDCQSVKVEYPYNKKNKSNLIMNLNGFIN